ncbi:MAG: TonB-dependent receptor [Candidatus Eisenbacteria bacterium]|nr:TonB-dependent receptor [Candidatus Eisenbacteria bacterium]
MTPIRSANGSIVGPRGGPLLRALPLLLLAMLIAFGGASAQQRPAKPSGPVGSIQGRVYDKETRDPVPFADVILVGTGKGVISGTDGTFRFVQIPEGIYQLRVNRMGYSSELIDQVRVVGTYAIKVDAGLSPIEVREMEPIEVSGLREIVDVEVAKSSQYVTAEEIQGMAVSVVSDVIGKQAGVVQEDGGLFVRGGRAEDTVYRIDGVIIRDLITGQSSAGNISARAVKSVEIMTGGYEAEFGQALSGVIDIETKEGSTEFQGYVEYQSDHLPLFGDIYRDTRLDNFEVQVEGEEPIQKLVLRPLGAELPGKITYFADVAGSFDDTYLPVRAADGSRNTLRSDYVDRFLGMDIDYGKSFWTPRAENRWSGLYKISWQPNGKHKLFLSFQKKLEIDHGFDRTTLARGVDPTDVASSYNWEWSRRKDHDYTVTDDNNTITLDWRYLWNRKTRTTVRLSRNFNAFFQNVYGRPWFTYEEPNDFDLPREEDTPFFVDTGDNTVWHSRYTEQYVGYFDVEHTRGEAHVFKTGFELSREDLQFVTIAEPWVADPDGLGRNHDLWNVRPTTGAIYIQDRFKYEGFIGHVGLRCDYWFPGKEAEDALRDTSRDSYNEALLRDYERDSHAFFGRNRVKANLEPRFQVSHPITDRSHLFLNYGHFSQRPNYYNVYSKISSVSSEDFPLVGNLNLNPKREVKYELGARHQIASDLAVDFSVFYNDIYDYPKSLRFDRRGRPEYFVYINEDFARARGIDINLRKNRSKYLWGRLAYSYTVATGKASDPNQFNLLQREVGTFTQIGRDEEYLYWNRPHKLTADLTMSVGENQDPPAIRGWTLPRDWSLNVYFWVQSGRAYTPTSSTGAETGTRYSANAPFNTTFDLRFSKGFRLGGSKWNYLIEGRNLFNHRYPKRIDPRTGDAYLPGVGSLDNETDVYTIARYGDPSLWSTPRSFRVGLSTEF